MELPNKKRFKGDKTLTILLALYLSLLPIEAILTIGSIGSLHKLLGIALIAYSLFKNGTRVTIKNGTSLVFALLTLLSNLWSIADTTTWAYSTTILTVVGLNFFVEQNQFTVDEYRYINNAIIAVGLFLAINVTLRTGLTVVQVGRTTIGYSESNRVDYNNLALGLSFSNILLMCELKNKTILKSILCVLGCLLITYATFLTGSRGGLLCFLFAAVVLILYYLRSSHIAVKLLIIAIGVVLAININAFISLVPTDMATRFTLADVQRNGGSGRYSIWSKGLSYFFDSGFFRQIFGIGYGAYPKMMSTTFGSYIAAHNDYIQILLELGFVGLISLLALFWKETKKSVDSNNIVSVVIMILVIVGAFSMETVFKKVTWGALLITHIARTTSNIQEPLSFRKKELEQ